MFEKSSWLVIAVVCVAQPARADDGLGSNSDAAFKPIILSLQPDQPESVYAPEPPARLPDGINEGGVNFELTIGYFTDYIYRGIEPFEQPSSEDSANLQIDAKLAWDLGKLPHPFIAVFSNIAESDPISTFQEIRPTVGFEWNLRPFIVSSGFTSYIYPDRDDQDTSEIWLGIELDDSYFLRTERPVLSPYVFAAYDIDLYDGWYIEAGVQHSFPIENLGLTLTGQACVGYVYNNSLYSTTPGGEDTGFQHYQLGLIGEYSLNHVLNFSQRYGQWSILGYLYYTGKIDDDLRADNQLWGGAGVGFKY
jgi:hypothetical protein